MSGQQNSLLPFVPMTLSLLHPFESTNFDLSSTNVQNATNQFTNMTEAAKRSPKLSSQKKSKRKPITKKWFDYDCKTLTRKKDLISMYRGALVSGFVNISVYFPFSDPPCSSSGDDSRKL